MQSVRTTAIDIRRRRFALASRGFDRDEVLDYLESVARYVEVLERQVAGAGLESGRGDGDGPAGMDGR